MSADKIRAVAIPGVALLLGFVMQLSGYQNPTLALLLLIIAVVWGGWALLTWTTFRRYLPQIQILPSLARQERAARNITVTPDTAALMLTAFAPTVTASGHQEPVPGREAQYRSALRRLIRRHYLAENPTGLSQEQREWQPAPKWYGDKLMSELGVPPEEKYD